jgi:hypothetical protein
MNHQLTHIQASRQLIEMIEVAGSGVAPSLYRPFSPGIGPMPDDEPSIERSYALAPI